ncbi:McrB family protein [Rhizobium sp. SU303]|uniref:McrB family protein n=1 Tax=Rhizobium sp. SU303 TaxID=3138065 RepID=UPI001E5E7421|nr:chromosome segregation ATPase-like protein [Rhizobium leguminosarum]UFW80137.1 chromosome segregation ATPase-like protein [Rhizobium leguminosarum bv. viciae]
MDDLKTEWLQQDERRAEVRAVREEIEEKINEKLAVESDLATGRADLEAVQERLAAAERLFATNDEMKREHAALEARLGELRSEAARLSEAQERVQYLEATASELARAVAQDEGRLEVATRELAVAREALAAEQQAVATVRAELTQAAARAAASEERAMAIESEIGKLDERRSSLMAQLARLEDNIGEAAGSGSGGEDDDDRIKELIALPPVLEHMKIWPERAGENEDEAITRVKRRLSENGLQYPDRTVMAFHTAMKTNETTQMAVLAGISGTGKSQLPRQYAAAMGIGFLQVPVQPRWDSPQDLMGFYNYIEKRFRPTDMARALYQLDTINNTKSEFQDRMMMVLLDEMNLARIEYYFSDFLSRLESRPSSDRTGERSLRKDAEIELEIPMPRGKNPPRIFPGYNLLFAGTMNEDESTQSLSDKVVDRANVIRFAAPKRIHTSTPSGKSPEPEALSARRWRSWVRSVSNVEGDAAVTSRIERMVEVMTDFKRPFGHRLGRAIMAYVSNYPGRGGDVRIPLADQIEMRLLPKLRGLEVDANDFAFGKLKSFVSDDLQDDALAQAIETSIQAARDSAGQFVWNGVSR